MSDKHIALIVEDEPEMAEELGDLLASLGHDHLHAATQEEARGLIDKGGFCYVLLDLQIKVNADSIRARVEAGQTLLRAIRERYPRRHANDRHFLPVLVMSGHAKEHHYVVEAFQAGADDFITKPVGENKPTIDVKIRDRLREAGRDHHGRCMTLEREAMGIDLGAGAAGGSPGLPLRITGRQEAKQTEIVVGEKAVLLTNGSLLILLRLVVGRLGGDDGWVHKNDLGAKTEQGWKGMSRLRGELTPHLPKKTQVTENDKSGKYRLHADLRVEDVDWASLQEHWDARVRELAARGAGDHGVKAAAVRKSGSKPRRS